MSTTTMDQVISPLAQYGVLGIFAILLIFFVRALLIREQDRSDAASAEVLRLNKLIQERTIPAIIGATQAIAASQELMREIQQERAQWTTQKNQRRT